MERPACNFEVYSQHLSRVTEENHKEPHSEREAGFETRSCRIESVIIAAFMLLYNNTI